MKVEQSLEFKPLTVTIETPAEAAALAIALGASNTANEARSASRYYKVDVDEIRAAAPGVALYLALHGALKDAGLFKGWCGQ